MSKGICICITKQCNWFKNRVFLDQSKDNIQTNHKQFIHVFPRFEEAKSSIFLSVDWFNGLSISFVTGGVTSVLYVPL